MSIRRPLRIAMVAGEMSGDLLGAGLIRELKKIHPDTEFLGIGGTQMLQEGLNSIVAMERLSVMGFKDVLLRLPEILRIHRQLVKKLINNPPDIFIGIDYSDFNLSVETKLKKQGIKTVHYVSPKIWAWREKRVFSIKKAVDLILTLFPFEEQFYQKYQVPVQFVGHPLADLIDIDANSNRIKKQMSYSPQDLVIAVLPGSRSGELKHMGPLFLDVMQEINLHNPLVHFIVPTASPKLRALFETQLQNKGYDLKVQITDGHAREAMMAANVVLTKAGTSTLEAMLLKRAMVVAFKCDAITYAIAAPLVKVPFISLPNLLAKQNLVPEYIQKEASPKPIANAVFNLLQSEGQKILLQEFTNLHYALRQNADEKAALAISKLLEKRC